MPLRAPGSAWLATSAVALYYVASMARDLSLYDSGELALAAVQLGLAHPPGQPLHTLLGHVFAHVPYLPALVGVNLLSALPGALALVPAASLADQLLGARARPIVVRLVPWFLALFALHPALWEPATRVEVYALATFLCVWSLAASFERPSPFAIGLALGLAAAANPVIALITGVAVAHRVLQARRWPLAIASGLLALALYAYVPLVANRTDVMVWGAPRDFERALRYFLLRDYALHHGISLRAWATHVADWFVASRDRGLVPWVVIGSIACAVLGRPSLVLVFALSLAYIALNVVWHVEIPDYDGYLGAGLWVLAAAVLAAGLRSYAQPALQRGSGLLTLITVIATLAAEPNLGQRTRSEDRLARTLAERVLEEAPARAIVIAETDAVTGALFYLQGAERARSDVTVLAYGLASSSWHWEELLRSHRDLAAFELRGPGGRAGRVQRMLAANAARPVLLERFATGRALGLTMCAGGLYLRAGAACSERARPDRAVIGLLARQLAALDDGSPGTSGAIAQLSYGLGEAWWRLGHATAAHDVLLAGVPLRARPARRAGAIEHAPALPLSAAGMHFTREAALGDPGRNLFLAGAIVGAAGQRELAVAYLEAAAAAGLPEARAAVGAPGLASGDR